MTDGLHIEYVSIDALKKHPRNPKDHDIGAISRSVGRFGFTSPVIVDERTGYLVAGHGRIDTLAQMKAQGKQPPANVQKSGNDWLVPVIRGVAFNSDAEVEAYLVADNRLTILGGWNEPELAGLLQDLAAQDQALLEATGYDADDLDAMINALTQPGDTDWGAALGGLATGDRAPFQQMTFTLHDDQAEQVKLALQAAKDAGPFASDNENSNGNALARICETYLTVMQNG